MLQTCSARLTQARLPLRPLVVVLTTLVASGTAALPLRWVEAEAAVTMRLVALVTQQVAGWQHQRVATTLAALAAHQVSLVDMRTILRL